MQETEVFEAQTMILSFRGVPEARPTGEGDDVESLSYRLASGKGFHGRLADSTASE